ncbi:MAG TPA: Rossmann-like and DUF2520 domain-containing protein [Ignavibacteriaceae bacterium]|nr:Rossmann-like and DUF2520 domain-containing protein [Ignavibacteriaceae bacterium]
MLNKKTEIVFIGAGKVAHTLVPLLIKKKYSVKGIISRDRASAASFSKKYELDFHSDNIEDIPGECKIFFITVPDDQVPNIAGLLAGLRINFRGLLFVHTSGSLSSKELNALKLKNAMTASFHIMQTFPSHRQTDITNSFAAIETESGTAEKFLFSLAGTLELKSFKLSGEAKVFYHLAGVFAANFLNANIFTSNILLEKTGLSIKEKYSLFEPIIQTTLSNIKNNGAAVSLSGPVERGDFKTILRHLDALRKSGSGKKNLLLRNYVSQSLILIEVLKSKGKDLTGGQKRVKKILDEELKKL